MLIGLLSTSCAGRSTIAAYLIEHHAFKPIPADEDVSRFVMQEFNWREDYFFFPLPEQCEEYQKRPFFLLVTIDAPVLLRYSRYQLKHNSETSLAEFIKRDDDRAFDASTLAAFNGADLKLISDFATAADLHTHLESCDITNPERLRPSWDTYFIKLCDWSARRSNCMKRRVGSILVKNKRILATGYNGTPRNVRNCNEGGCPRCNSGARCGDALDLCFCLHAEENALLEAGRERIESGGSNTILYCSTCPCLGCAKKIIQCGVVEVVYRQSYGMDQMTLALFNEAGVKLRQFIPKF